MEGAGQVIHPTLMERVPRRVLASAPGGRSHAAWDGGDPRVSLDLDSSSRVVMHELGHLVEYSNPGLFRKAVAFLDERANGRLIERDGGLVVEFTDKHAGDMGKKWYPRKLYEIADSPNRIAAQLGGRGAAVDVTATEVVSSAVQYMENPQRFLDKAPEFFWWTVE